VWRFSLGLGGPGGVLGCFWGVFRGLGGGGGNVFSRGVFGGAVGTDAACLCSELGVGGLRGGPAV